MLGLAFVLTLLSGGGALATPGLLGGFRAAGAWLLWLCLPFFSIPLAVLGYGSGFLNGDGPQHLSGHTEFSLSLGKSFGENFNVNFTAQNLGEQFVNDRALLRKNATSDSLAP